VAPTAAARVSSLRGQWAYWTQKVIVCGLLVAEKSSANLTPTRGECDKTG